MSDALFGPNLLPDAVEQAVIDTGRLWLPEYLAWTERRLGLAPHTLPAVESWVPTADLTRWPEEQLPSVLVMNTGLAEPPVRHGRDYTAKFAVGLAVVVSAKDSDSTERLAKHYTALLRAIMLHHPDLGGIADAVEWLDEGYDALPSGTRRRALAAGQCVFRVEVPEVVSMFAGIRSEPRDDPYAGPPPDDPTVAKTTVTVSPERLT